MNLVSSLIDDFFFTSFQEKNEIKERKYPTGIQIFTFLLKQKNDPSDVKDVWISKKIWQMVIWSENMFKGNLM